MGIDTVIIFTNGNVMVCDENGEQMCDYQGFILDIAGKLKTDCDKDTKWKMGSYRDGVMEANFSWWFAEREGE